MLSPVLVSMCRLHSQMSSEPVRARYSCWVTLGILCMKRETVHFPGVIQPGVTMGQESDPLE